MANLHLRRFSTLETYQNANINDGSFFVIVESGQLGVRKGDTDILTAPNTLHGYQIPDTDFTITEKDTLIQAIAKLDKRIQVLGDDAASALGTAQDALNSVKNLEYTGELNPDHEARITSLESKIKLISEDEFDALTGLDANKIYYIYEND